MLCCISFAILLLLLVIFFKCALFVFMLFLCLFSCHCGVSHFEK